VTDFENNPVLNQACMGPAGTGTTWSCPIGSQYTSGGPSTRLFQTTFDRFTGQSVATFLFNGLGHHVIKVGANAEYTVMDNVKAHSGGANMLEQVGINGPSGSTVNDAEQYGVLIGPDHALFAEPFHLKTKSIIVGGFAQDSWAILDIITANIGVRYDVQQMYGASGDLGLSVPNQWSPRIGLIYDPTQEGRAKIFANYARYYENIPLGLADGSLTGEPSILANHPAINTMTGAVGGTCDVRVAPYCQGQAPGNRIVSQSGYNPSQYWTHFGFGQDPVDPNIMPTSTDDFVAGGEYEILKDARLGASYQRRWINSWIEDMSNDNRSTFFIGNPGYGWAGDWPKAERIYDAVTLYFMKSFANNWLTSASYTISYNRGNTQGLFKTSNNELDPNRNADFDTKAFLINNYGPAPSDHTHDIKLFAAKDWVLSRQHAISTGGAFRATSGAPYNYYGGDPYYGQSINLLLPRGSGGRLPWLYDVDVNLGYRFAIDKDKSIGVTVDIFNLLNFQEETQVDENYTFANAVGKQDGKLTDVRVIGSSIDSTQSRPLNLGDKNPNFGNALSYQQPRFFRFGIRGTF
jgi:hypothetical protein